jgi:macrolide transport system ATP-binding/permease protein
MQVIGRIRPGVMTAQAETELLGVYKEQAAAEHRAEPNTRVNEARPIVLRPAARGYSSVRNRLEKPLLVLMTVVALVLLIACANVANLMLARGAARQREMAVRLAVGATRMRLTSQLLVESLLIALLGGACGLFLSYIGVHAMLKFLPQIGSNQVVVDVRYFG